MDKLATIPSLAQGQSVAEWRNLYEPATVLLSEPQRIALLPCYVNRNKGQVEIAQICAREATLNAALTKLEQLLEGGISRVDNMHDYFTVNTDTDPTSLFFELKAAGSKAGIPNFITFLRFCGLIPGGRKFYDQNKAEIDAGVNDAKLMELYTRIQPTFAKDKLIKPPVKEEALEAFQFPISVAEQPAPSGKWISEFKQDLLEGITQRLSEIPASYNGESDSSDGGSVYKYQETKKASSKKPLRCEKCNKGGHTEESCFKRICENCEGMGHGADKCPTAPRRKRSDRGKKRA